MIDKLMTIAKLVTAILPFVVLCFASREVNLPKPDRSRQLPMPVIAVIYVIVAMILMDNINDWLINPINNIPVWISGLGKFSWMPDRLTVLIDRLSRLVQRYIESLNLNFWIFFISNTVIITVYLALKRCAIELMCKFVKPGGFIHEKIAEAFYEYFPEMDKWCIRENCVQARGMLRVFYYSAVALSSLLMLLSRNFFYNGLMKSVFYPVFGILVVGELYFYLDGATKREYVSNILGEDEEAYKTVNYSLLRKFLRSIFGDKLLAENTGVNSAMSYGVSTDQIIRELEMSEDPKVSSFASYYEALNNTGFSIDHNYLYSSLDLLNGKSILFNDPFYNDLIPYAFYPMNRALLSHKKVLVVLGRHAIENDIKEWIEKGIETVTNLPFMWNIEVLNGERIEETDIGIIARSDVFDIGLVNANADFLENVGFVVILEPSKLISTAQIGLNLIIRKCRDGDDKHIVYCMIDKNCDGLVDAMSHILMTSITEVSATNKHFGTSSYMCWEADSEYLHHRLVPNISRYLGMGTELSFAALKNQVSKTKWFGGEAFPVTDMRWIDKQYYYDLTKYAGIATNQESMDEHFETYPNLWSAAVERNSYITVEDESYNMFEILRDFSTRATEQGFVNIISSDYLLKDYMADNASIFEADSKAIPYIAADYTRSNRNVVLKLILMMSSYKVSSEAVAKELSLLGIEIYDLRRQFWYELYCCYGSLDNIATLSDDYEAAVREASLRTVAVKDAEFDIGIIRITEEFNIKTGKPELIYSISDEKFLSRCVSELRSAGYMAEDEEGGRYYLGSELAGHIYQRYLPGQFFTFGGKYYEMQYLTSSGDALVRRAADHINGRPSYRQIRQYSIRSVKPSDKIGAVRDEAGLKISREFADISVVTPGYYHMEKYNDFTTAKPVYFEGERNSIPEREYRNKEILRVELPDADGKLSDNVRYTVTLLFNEIFRTIFAENHPYIVALTDDSFIGDGQRLLTCSISGDGCEIDKNSIYIIEDSQLDLGLTVAVERNLERIFKIAADYLDWNRNMLEYSLDPPPEPRPPVEFGGDEDENAKTKRAIDRASEFIKRIAARIKGAFRRKPKPVPTEENPPENTEEYEREPSDETVENDPVKAEDVPENTAEDDPEDDFDQVDDSDSADESSELLPVDELECPDPLAADSGSEEHHKLGVYASATPYQRRYYLLYGYDCEAPCIDPCAALDYLNALGMDRNSLRQARESKNIAEIVEATFKPGKPDARYCDFCGAEIYGVEYETLADGRDRCLSCGRTAIKTEEEFRKIFADVKRNMESFFGIRINTGIRVEMVNSKKLHKRLGAAFVPTPGMDGRVLGVAIKDKNGYTLMVENGSPRMASMLTMAHELTHIWQYLNWNDRNIRRKYGRKMRLEIYEGMAKWVEIQYAYLINEPAIAKREELITAYRDDEYGRGFLRYRANYPFSRGTVITKPTPFLNVETPLDPDYCGRITVIMPKGEPADGRDENS